MRNSRFLVVDDSKIILSAVRNILTNRIGSDEVLLAKNGQDALSILKEHKIDIIISDWHMPKLDGLQLLEEIRNNNELRDIPFIMMSTHGNKEDVVSAIQQGVNQYVVKPFSPEKIDDAVRKAYNSAKKRAARRYSGLPLHTLTAKFGDKELEAKAVDISRSGSLIKLVYDSSINLFDNCEITLDFEDIDELAIINIGPIVGKVIRISTASGYHPSTKKCDVALNFEPELISDDVKGNLKSLLKFLADKEVASLVKATS